MLNTKKNIICIGEVGKKEVYSRIECRLGRQRSTYPHPTIYLVNQTVLGYTVHTQ